MITTQQLNEILARKAIARRNPAHGPPQGAERKPWTEPEIARLREYYATTPADIFNLEPLAAQLGRTYMAVALKASELKLCDYSRRKSAVATERMATAQKQRAENPAERERRSNNSKKWHSKNEHPKGFAGGKRTPEERAKISTAVKAMWADPNHKVNSPEHRQRISDWSTQARAGMTAENCFSRTKKGQRPDMPGIHFRSAWEANYARYLAWLQSNGQIVLWRYEPKTFWFESIKRGCRSWKPDFLVVQTDGREEYHEVKGWMYPRSKTALKRMKKYHPAITVILIDEHRYKALAKQLRYLIPHWE